jgi:vitamin B12 transporter
LHFDRPNASAWHARRRLAQAHAFLAACLLGGAGVGLPRTVHAETGVPERYETVVLAPRPESQVPREDTAAAASVVSSDRTPRAAETVPQLLSELAGVSVTRMGGMGSTATLSLRGSTSNQVLVYVDGVPYNTVTGGGVDLGAIPLGDVERLEVYRGMSPIAFGASAIGGVVSVATAVPESTQAKLDVGTGSFGTYFGGARGALRLGRWRLYAGVHLLGSQGDFSYVDTTNTNYGTGDDVATHRLNNDLRQVDSTAKAIVDLDPERQLTATVLFFDRHQGMPGVAGIANPTARLESLRATAIVSYTSIKNHGSARTLRATLYGSYNLSHFADPDHKINSAATDAHDRTHSAGGTLNFRKLLRPWFGLATVLDARFDRFRPTESLGGQPVGAPATRIFGAGGIEGDAWIERARLDLIASLRVEAAREETSGRDSFGNFLPSSAPVAHVLPIVRLSLVKTLGNWVSLRVNGGRYARLPSSVELYGNTGYLLGNPGLKPESGLNADVGPVICYSGPVTRFAWSTALFASRVTDLIQYRLGGMRARPENIGGARIYGVETSVDTEVGRHARMVASATYTDARDASTVESQNGNQLPLRPRYRFYARPEWRAVTVGGGIVLGLYADIDATAGNFRDAPNTSYISARLLFGAGAFAELPAGFSLRLSGQNLGNSRINDIANYPLPGREAFLSLLWSSANRQTKEP